MSNFDLLRAVKTLPITHFKGVFMKDQLPKRPHVRETGIINLDDHHEPGTHWTCYAISPDLVIYFDSYGLPPPQEFINYVKSAAKSTKSLPLWYSTLPTQTLTDPPICGMEVLNVLTAISMQSSRGPHKAVHEYTIFKEMERILT